MLRVQVAAGEVQSFAYVHDYTVIEGERALPEWNEAEFPHLRWGVTKNPNGFSKRRAHSLRGLIALEAEAVGKMLTSGEWFPERNWVWAISNDGLFECPLHVESVPCRQEWTPDHSQNGGFYRSIPARLTLSELLVERTTPGASQGTNQRELASSMRIIAAMRELLMAGDGGNFPSDAKVIDQLVQRYGQAEGISKRNLESVFAAAKRIAGSSLRPKE